MLEDFFQLGPIPSNIMGGYYEGKLILLSYVVACLASLAALEIAQGIRARIRENNLSIFWPLIGGAFAMGAGIFSMHFVGMLSFVMPMEASYHFTLTFLSLVIAVVASGFSFFLVKEPTIKPLHFRFIAGGFILGLSIASMHYTGMAAMSGVEIRYLPGLFILSIVVAIGASLAALFLMLECEKGSVLRQRTMKTFSALVMGAAICSMHYIGMEAAVMVPAVGAFHGEESFSLSPERLAFVVAFVTSSIMIITLLLSGYRHLLLIKMLVGFLIAPLLLVPLAVVFLQNIQIANQWNAVIMEEIFPRIQALGEISSDALKVHSYLAKYSKGIQVDKNKIMETFQQIDQWKNKFSELNSEGTHGTSSNTKELNTLLNKMRMSTLRIIELIENEAPKPEIEVAQKNLEQDEESFDFFISDAISLEREKLALWNKKNLENANNSTYLFLLIVGTIFLFSVIAGILIAYQISKPVYKIRNISRKIAKGDLTEKLQVDSTDEIGQMGSNFNEMIDNLKQISDALTVVSKGDLTVQAIARSDQDSLGKALAGMIKNLRHITEEIQNGVTQLNHSSHQIVSSVSHIASSASETAAAVTETTTSVEELRQTANLTDDMAKNVLENSEITVQIVRTSENLLKETMQDMNQISLKMSIISEAILKLSDNSRIIGNIIDTVNDLAEQSNLLAVNAAIEAAQAGEHGKAFSVVAKEIRRLAEQSKSATIQVRTILKEIQTSTSNVVLATEEGGKAVEKGVRQSIQTNESMLKLSQSMAGVANAANHIAISSQQQFTGVDQLTVAMRNISDSTSQLVDNMKQIESATTSLNAIGENLKEITNHYILYKKS